MRYVWVLCVVALAGCGSSEHDPSVAEAAKASVGKVVAEEQATKTALDRAVNSYREGDRDKALKQIGQAAREHFVYVSAGVRRVDPALAASLEQAMTTDVPHAANEGVTVSQLARAVARLEASLDLAVAKLKR